VGSRGKDSENLIAPCGIDCRLCSAYLAWKNQSKDKGLNFPYCRGCRPQGKECAFIKKRCEKLYNEEIDYCWECELYPCGLIEHLDKRYRTHFRQSPIENLAFVKKHGLKKFLAAQRKKWACQKCRGMKCTHNGLCFVCDVEKIRGNKKLYRWKE
jgi:hypothetical protein